MPEPQNPVRTATPPPHTGIGLDSREVPMFRMFAEDKDSEETRREWRQRRAGALRLVGLSTVAGMLVLVVGLRLVWPALDAWKVQVLTIVTSTAVAMAATWRVFNVLARTTRRLVSEATQRTRVEATNRALEKHVMERAAVEAELRTLIGAMSDVIIVFDRDGTYLRIAPNAGARLMRRREELVGRRIAEFFPAEEAERFTGWIRRALDENERVEAEYALEIDGYPVWFAATISAMTPDSVLWVARDISERKVAEDRLRRDAYVDALTNLPNRAYINDYLARQLARLKRHQHECLVVLFLDCDRFKVVNDSLGHTAGDELLRMVADRLVGVLRPEDVVGRLGGDEFLVVLSGIWQNDVMAGVASVVGRVNQALAAPLLLAGREIVVSGSVGVAIASGIPEDVPEMTIGLPYETPDDLLRDADLAMYQAKAMGRGTHAVFRPSLRQAAERRLALEGDLRRALEREELRLHYQPLVDATTGAMLSVEALVRWQHPERGLISPAEFLPIAEETGLIVPLGTWVLREATRQSAAWRDADGAGVPVTCNVVQGQLLDPRFADFIRDLLAERALPPRLLKLEVTERILQEEAAAVVPTLERLAQQGIQLLLDDFGAGHSSLSYLHRFPLAALKIDQYFVQRIDTVPECREIVRTILQLGRALGLRTVGEGVEQEAHASGLRELGCDELQGYLFARPLPAEELEREWLATRTVAV